MVQIRNSTVVDLLAYRSRKQSQPAKRVLYISNGPSFTQGLQSLFGFDITQVTEASTLYTVLAVNPPQIILVESSLSWSRPLDLISMLQDSYNEVPLILVCVGPRTEKQSTLIKQAYAAGVTDVLFTPLCRDEALESLKTVARISSVPDAGSTV
jgi:PleD family two-component response regulator